MNGELQIFNDFVREKGLHTSKKRDVIVQIFLKTDEHISLEDLYLKVKKQHPQIGYTTVYRTVKLIVDSGLAEKVDFDDGVRRYERKIGREYHAHFICTSCGKHIEAFDENIQVLASQLARRNAFVPQKHRMEIFGLCRECN